MKKTVRLTESELINVIKRIINEQGYAGHSIKPIMNYLKNLGFKEDHTQDSLHVFTAYKTNRECPDIVRDESPNCGIDGHSIVVQFYNGLDEANVSVGVTIDGKEILYKKFEVPIEGDRAYQWDDAWKQIKPYVERYHTKFN